jgi:hypothetical protein
MLHPLAQDGVLRLTADFDRETLADFYARFFDRIRELDALACRVKRRPCAQDDIDRLDAGLTVGRHVLRRPSAGALDWLRSCASDWWGESTRVYGIALAFACAHRDAATYDRLRQRHKASLVIWAWAIKAGASEEALRRAALSLLPPPDESAKWFADPDDDGHESGHPDLMAIACSLSRCYGQTPSFWLWEVADDDFWGAVCDIQDEAEAKELEMARASGKEYGEDCWWRRHRRALVKCETALEESVAYWLEKRKVAENG